ncbi:TerB [Escherichia coli]|nr:TerB [Escherichia coli]
MSFFDKVKGAINSGRDELTARLVVSKTKNLCTAPLLYVPVLPYRVTA